jgi:hypothetical protein
MAVLWIDTDLTPGVMQNPTVDSNDANVGCRICRTVSPMRTAMAVPVRMYVAALECGNPECKVTLAEYSL